MQEEIQLASHKNNAFGELPNMNVVQSLMKQFYASAVTAWHALLGIGRILRITCAKRARTCFTVYWKNVCLILNSITE